ncbi:MAG: hypothetical protein PHZ19_07170 [Candidatus Thermoplasmatota archaeon]|nr:hypothetical protein [Candidatus Thermoplasmatota archaeon]
MDFTTLTILAILSFILAWFGIMIFTTTPKEEEAGERREQANAQPQYQHNPQPNPPPQQMPHMVPSSSPPIPEPAPVAKVAKIAEDGPMHDDEVAMYRALVDKYSNMVLQLKKKIELLENTTGYAGVSNDKLIDWISELRKENKYLKARLMEQRGDGMEYEEEPGNEAASRLRSENEELRQKLDHHVKKVGELEQEMEELKSGLHYYRDMVNKLQGSYTVINKYNYRTCIRDPKSSEFHYELVKFPPDFDPFNPTYITRDGMEIYENYGIKIPTKLGDIVREEFRKSTEYWEEDAGIDWKLGR